MTREAGLRPREALRAHLSGFAIAAAIIMGWAIAMVAILKAVI